MTSSILYDADFIIALLVPQESTHAEARRIYSDAGKHKVFLLDIVRYEVVTVLSRKYDAATARLGFERTSADYFLPLQARDIERRAWDEFLLYSKKSISFFDCANLVAARHYALKIASFDSFYPKSMLVK